MNFFFTFKNCLFQGFRLGTFLFSFHCPSTISVMRLISFCYLKFCPELSFVTLKCHLPHYLWLGFIMQLDSIAFYELFLSFLIQVFRARLEAGKFCDESESEESVSVYQESKSGVAVWLANGRIWKWIFIKSTWTLNDSNAPSYCNIPKKPLIEKRNPH